MLTSLQTAARIAAAREDSLVKSLNEAKGDVSRSNDQDIELRALEREATAQRDLLESFLSRYREAVARTDANYLPADARVISRAVAPQNPSFPKKGMMSIAAAIAVLLIASAVVLFREFMSGRAFRVIGFAGSSGGFLQLSASKPEPKASEAPESTIRKASAKKASAETEAPWAEPEEEETALEDEEITATADAEEEPEDEPVKAALVAPIVADSGSEGGDMEAAELAAIIADPTVRLALFAGARGSEGAGEIAFSAAREAAKEKLRSIVIDIGRKPSSALGYERPGLCDLLGGSASFGEVIQRDDAARVHMIPYGATGEAPPMQRMQLAVAALAHSYDRVILVADKLADWPDRHLRPDVAALVCGPETTERLRAEVYRRRWRAGRRAPSSCATPATTITAVEKKARRPEGGPSKAA